MCFARSVPSYLKTSIARASQASFRSRRATLKPVSARRHQTTILADGDWRLSKRRVSSSPRRPTCRIRRPLHMLSHPRSQRPPPQSCLSQRSGSQRALRRSQTICCWQANFPTAQSLTSAFLCSPAIRRKRWWRSTSSWHISIRSSCSLDRSTARPTWGCRCSAKWPPSRIGASSIFLAKPSLLASIGNSRR